MNGPTTIEPERTPDLNALVEAAREHTGATVLVAPDPAPETIPAMPGYHVEGDAGVIDLSALASLVPAAPPPVDAHQRAAMEAALRSPAPLIQVPPGFMTEAELPALDELMKSCRRVIVATNGPTFAVRPKLGCRRCSGSARYRVVRKGVSHPCGCVNDQITNVLYPQEQRRAVEAAAKAAQKTTTAEPAPSERNGRLVKLEGRLQQLLQQREAALAPIDRRIAEHEAAELSAGARVQAAADAASELAVEVHQRRRLAEHYERMAREERENIKTIEAARDAKLAEQRQHAKEQGAATADKVAAVGDRQRVVTRWAERTRPTERAIERLRRKAGLVETA